MENNKTKKKVSVGKVILITIGTLLGIILALGGVLYAVFFNEVNAVFSVKKVEENVYYMEYNNEYYFDDFLKQGAKNDSELISFLISKVLKGLPINIALPDFGCSSFTATTENGDNIYARNYDLDYSPILITKTDPNNGYKSLSTSDLRALGFTFDKLPDGLMDKFMLLAAPYIPFDGINEKGVSMSVNMVSGDPTKQNTGKISLTTTTLIRLVLDKAASVEEALTLISKYDLSDSTGGPFHYQIADKTGDSAVVEYINNELKITRKTGKFLAMTNFLVHADATPDDFGRDRYDILQNELTANEAIMSEDEAFGLLQKVFMGPQSSTGGTMWSNVFNLDKLTMTFSPYKDHSKKLSFAL